MKALDLEKSKLDLTVLFLSFVMRFPILILTIVTGLLACGGEELSYDNLDNPPPNQNLDTDCSGQLNLATVL